MNQDKKAKQKIFFCRHCGNRTSHIEVHSHTVDHVVATTSDGNYGKVDIKISEYYLLFECQTCKGIALKVYSSEDIDPDPELGYIEIDPEQIQCLYPQSKEFDQDIPPGLNNIISEANKVKWVSKLAYVILVRKVIEEICKDREITERNLKKQLDKLIEKENLPEVFQKSTDTLRLLGTIGAHESKISISKDDVNLIDEFLYALIEHIYVLPSKLEKLDQAFKKQKQSEKTT